VPALLVLVMALVMTLAGLTTAHANGSKTAPGQVKKSAPTTSPSPSPSPSVTPSPTAEPTASPSPTAEPTAPPSTSSPSPTPVGEVTVHVDQNHPAASDSNSGTSSAPVRTVQRGVQLADGLNGAGTPSRVLVAAGVYRESVSLNGQKTDAAMTLEGAVGTFLTGSDRWTQFQAQPDGSLVHHWPHKWGMKPVPNGWGGFWDHDGKGTSRDVLRRSETVYVNGQPLRGVLSLSALVHGTFYVDEASERLHVRLPSGQSATGADIEVGTRLTPLSVNARRNVTIRRLEVVRNRGAVQDTGLRVTNSRNVTLDGVTVRHLAYQAFGSSYNNGITIRNSQFLNNGVMALAQFRDVNVLIEDSKISGNNWRGWPAEFRGWDSVHKWGGVRDGVMRRVEFSDNQGNGFWLDTDNVRVSLEDSLVARNQLNGVSLENNQGPIDLRNNRICSNGQAGIGDAQSDRVTITGNRIWGTTRYNIIFTGTYAGQSMRDWQTGESYTNRSLNWTLDGNSVVGSGAEGWLWWHTDYLAPGAWAQVRNTMKIANNNTWFHSGRTNAFRLPQGSVAHSSFRGDLQTADPAHESASTWSVPQGTCSG
jgi:hypothetical protein